ncbi:MAG: hypothetical protein A2046_06545 [Bacteroidetes bacterium GWA2_30_7]|nr:MAG: hypothetical protein A2046_06545 [Bacteroidetes bacterium GWA2_30_7]
MLNSNYILKKYISYRRKEFITSNFQTLLFESCYYLILFILFTFTFYSCRKVIDVELPSKEGKIVINSFFNNNESLIINISKSLHILDNKESKLLDDAIVNIYENNVFKEKLTNINNGNYIANTFIPSFDKLYKVNVSYPDLKDAYSENMIPMPIKIISIDTSTVYTTNNNTGMNQNGGNSYPQYQLKIKFKDNESVKNFYSLNVFVKNQNSYIKSSQNIQLNNYYPIYFTSTDLIIESMQNNATAFFSDDFINGKEYVIIINIDKYNFPNTNNEVLVVLNSVSEDYFLYSKSYNLYQSVKGNPFAEPVQVYNNIENGYGIFAGYSSDTLGLNLAGYNYYPIE